MEIVIKGGMYDRKKSESEKVFLFNANIPFFKDFDPRNLNVGEKNKQAREYTFIIRTTDAGFDYGVHFLNIEYGPRKAAVSIFIRAGWMIPNRGDVLAKKLREMAEKTLNAIGKYVDGYDDENPQGQLKNPLSEINLDEIKNECDFWEVDKITIKEKLSEKRIFLIGVSNERDFFENPYQEGQMSPKGVVWSAWDGISQETRPNDIVQRGNFKRNYLYKSVESRLFSLKLQGNEVEVKYLDPIQKRTKNFKDKIFGSDSSYLKYENGRFVSQKTAKEANIPFNYEIKLCCVLKGEYNSKEIYSHQAPDGILKVEYREIPKRVKLSFSETEPVEIEITENDIKQGRKMANANAKEEEFEVKISGKGFSRTPIRIKVDAASPAYDSLKKISYEDQTIKVPRKNPVVKFLKEYKTLWLVLLGLFTLGVVIYYLYKFAFGEEQGFVPQNNQTEITTIPAENKIDKDKTYFSQNNIWSYASLQSSEGRRFYEAVLAWDLDKINNDRIFRRWGDNKTLNNAVLKGDDHEIKDKIVDYLKSKTSKIDLNELSEKIDELINQAANTTSVGDAKTDNP